MSPEKEQALYRTFGTLFRESPTEYISLEIGNGWYSILYQLCNKLTDMDLPNNFKFVQIKEKFGGLRIYTNQYIPEVQQLVDIAETASFATCERCGKPGTTSSPRNWILTLCPEHIEQEKRRNIWSLE